MAAGLAENSLAWADVSQLIPELPFVDQKPVIFGLIFLSAFMFVEFMIFALEDYRSRRGGRAHRRLVDIATRLHSDHSAEATSILRKEQELSKAWSIRLPVVESLSLLLYRAGRPLRVQEFWWLSFALCVGGIVIGNFLIGEPRLGALLSLAGFLPLLWVYLRKRSRMRRFELMLPEALELLSRALRAGHAVSPSLQMVGQELGDPVGTEFAMVSEEVQLGLDLPVALSNLAHRIDAEDLPFFVTALMIQRETGGNLAEIVDNLSSVIRERHTTEGKVRSLTAQTRWSANILLFAPFVFVLLMKLQRPEYLAPLFDTEVGRMMGIGATTMVLVGYALCRRLGVVRI